MTRFGFNSRPATAVAPRPSKPAAAPAAAPLTHQAIATRAYQICERKGKPQGQCEQNWREAEQELRAAQKRER